MNIATAAILGLVQGLTEFIPVSSSGHLVLARELLGLPLAGTLAFDAVLQLATTFAIAVYFRQELVKIFSILLRFLVWPLMSLVALLGSGVGPKDPAWMFGKTSDEERKLVWALIVGTIPAVVLGLLLEDLMDTIFRASVVVAITLVLGALLMLLAELISERFRQRKDITPLRGWWIGLFQSLALVPGMSRSGSTISGGMIMGLSRREATRFAFLLGLPILFGSGMKELLALGNAGFGAGLIPLAVGSLVAFGSGLAAIHWLIRYLENHTLTLFVVYRLILAVIVLFVLV
jgi:undecaprenyl-diphosphatase